MSTTADSSDDNLQLPRSRILLVDDTPQNLVALEVVLEDMDCDLDSVTSGNAALAKLLKEDSPWSCWTFKCRKWTGLRWPASCAPISAHRMCLSFL